MQTFLPHPSFLQSAQCLDRQRLGKQRVEAKQIYLALTDPSYGWQHHPAVNMWRDYEQALACYGWHICTEWVCRGYNDSLQPYFADKFNWHITPDLPPWFGNSAFHLSHQSNLVRKNPTHYRRFFPDVPDNLPYIWPTSLPHNASLSITSGTR